MNDGNANIPNHICANLLESNEIRPKNNTKPTCDDESIKVNR